MPAGRRSSDKLALHGDLTIRSIAKAHKKIAAAFVGTSDLCIDFSGAKETDLTLIQLIHSARRSAQLHGKSICLAQPLPEALISELTRGGFLDTDDNFWTSAG